MFIRNGINLTEKKMEDLLNFRFSSLIDWYASQETP